MTASGTFGSGREFSEYMDIGRLGAITVKGVSERPWKGNPPPRIAETASGMLNSVGLQNNGVEHFIKEDLPFLKKSGTKIIVNVAGHSINEYKNVVSRLATEDIDFLELNISCPNVSEGGQAFGTNPSVVERVVSEVKKCAKQPLIVKLSPNVTDITETAKAAESAGADALSLINTLLGMKIDIKTRKPVLANKVGGLSGPAIKPIAVRMVWQVSKAVSIPVIGMGGIKSGEDALEFIMAGAHAFAVGCANFSNPTVTLSIIDYIEKYLSDNNLTLEDIRGIV